MTNQQSFNAVASGVPPVRRRRARGMLKLVYRESWWTVRGQKRGHGFDQLGRRGFRGRRPGRPVGRDRDGWHQRRGPNKHRSARSVFLQPSIDTDPSHYPANVWVTDGMVKVHPDALPGTVHWALLWSAKNEFESFQVMSRPQRLPSTFRFR